MASHDEGLFFTHATYCYRLCHFLASQWQKRSVLGSATWKTDQEDFGAESLSGSKLGNDIYKRDRSWLSRELLNCNGVTTEMLANPMGVLELE